MKRNFKNYANRNFKNHYGKNVFVTGASSGIGKACALMFAQNGCRVTGVSRSIEEKNISFEGGGSLSAKRLDITDEKAVRKFVNELDGVDIAVLCAGMGIAGPAETTGQELTKEQMNVNYFGTINAAQPCLTRMRENGRGLLIVIGSVAGRVSIPMQSQYSASKFALEAFTDAVRMEMKRFGVRASIIEPGDTRTGFTAARETDETVSGYKEVLEKSVGRMARDEQNGRPPESVALEAIRLAGKKEPPARVPVGLEYKLLMFLLRFIPDRLREFILTKMYLPEA